MYASKRRKKRPSLIKKCVLFFQKRITELSFERPLSSKSLMILMKLLSKIIPSLGIFEGKKCNFLCVQLEFGLTEQ